MISLTHAHLTHYLSLNHYTVCMLICVNMFFTFLVYKHLYNINTFIDIYIILTFIKLISRKKFSCFLVKKKKKSRKNA